jgi:DNA-directed RNA polymerase subunit beta
VIPSRGAWLEFEIDKRDMVGVRIDRKRKQSVTVLLKALGWSDEQILETFGEYESIRPPWRRTTPAARTRRCSTSTASCARASRRRGGGPGPAGQLLLQPEALRPGQGRPLQAQQEARPRGRPVRVRTLTVEDIVATIRYVVALHEGESTRARHARRPHPSRPTTSTTSATAASAPSAS